MSGLFQQGLRRVVVSRNERVKFQLTRDFLIAGKSSSVVLTEVVSFRDVRRDQGREQQRARERRRSRDEKNDFVRRWRVAIHLGSAL